MYSACEVTSSLLDTISDHVTYFIVGSLYCFNQSLYCFLWEKVDGFEKRSRLLSGSEKNQLLLLTLTFITNTKQ